MLLLFSDSAISFSANDFPLSTSIQEELLSMAEGGGGGTKFC